MTLSRIRRKSVGAFFILASSAALLVPARAAIDTSTWASATSGSWNVDANWTNVPVGGGFPNNGNGGVATYDAVISATGAAYTVTLSTNVTVEDLTISSANATLNQTAGIFTATNAIALNAGIYQLSGGTISNTVINLSGTGSLVMGASNSNLLTGVTVNGDLTLNTTSARTKIEGGTTFTTAHLAANVAELGFAPGSTMSGVIQLEGGAGNRFVSMNSSAGALTIGAAGVIRTQTGFTGDGVIGGGNNYGGAMALTNQGLISSQITGRTISIVSASLANTGTLSASSGGILTISPTAAWSNGGTISVNNATVNLGGTFNATGGIGTWSNTGGIVNINGTINNTGNTLTLNTATGSWTLNGGTLSGGALAFANGQALFVNSVSSNLITGVTVNGDLTLNVTSARTKIEGGTTFTTAHLAANVAELGFAPGSTLTGTVLLEGGAGNRFVSPNGTAGAFTIGATGVIRTETGFTGDGVIGSGNNFGGTMTLTNQGLISSQVSGRTITITASSLANTGTLSASNGGILTIAPTNPWTNGGTISVNSSTVNLNSTFNATGGIGTWNNTGTSTVNINGTINNAGNTLTLNTATGSWTMNGGTLSGGALAFANGQALFFNSASGNLLTGVTVNGDLTLNVGSARTKIEGGTTFTTAHLAASASELGFAPGSTLNGTILFEGLGGTRYVALNGTPGALTIGATGVIRTETGLTSGDGLIGTGNNYGSAAMALTNQGLISSQISGRTITINAASLTNTGTLSASNGGILTIAPVNPWTNGGTISVNNATVNLNSTYNITGGIGTWSNTGASTVNINGTINNAGNTLTLNTATGSWTMNGGTLSGGTLAFANGQTLLIASASPNLITGVTVNGDLTLNVGSARTKIEGGTTFTTAHLMVSATELGFAPGSTLGGTILFEGGGGSRYVALNGSTGTFTIGATGVIRTETGLTGDGVIGTGNNYGGTMTLTNQGLISSPVAGRTITITASTLNNSGTLAASNSGILTIAPTNPWTNAGTITVNNATVNLNSTFDVTGGIGTWSNTSGTVNINGTINNAGSTLTLNTATGSWTMNGGTLSGGTLAFANGQTLLIAAAGSNLITGVTVNGDLTLNTTSARTKIAGGTFATAHLAANASELGFAPSSTLSGTILFEGGAGARYVSMNGTPGTFTVGAAGVIRTETGLTGDGVIGNGNNYGGAMTLANQGLISSQVTGRTITLSPTALSNAGTLSASNGGIVTINPTNPWTNAGTIVVNAATVNLNSTFDATGGIGTWSNTGGTVNINGVINNLGSTLLLNAATGSWTLNGGSISGGTLAFAAGQLLLIAASNSNLLTAVTVNGDLTFNTTAARTKIGGGTTFTTAHLAANAAEVGFAPGSTLSGTILFEGGSGSRYVSMNGTAGAFTVGASGVIRTETGTTSDGVVGGGNNYVGAMALTNQGLISSQISNRTITINPVTFSNAGNLSASNGGFLTINPTNPWTNAGTITVNGSTVNLSSTFDATGGIGTWSNTAGTVNINGTINNAGNTLTLNNATGSWTLNGGTVGGGTVATVNGQALIIAASGANLLTGVTVNGDLAFSTAAARTKVDTGTTFTTAHLAANAAEIGFAPGSALTGTILFEGPTGQRFVSMNNTAGTFTVGPTGVIRTQTGLTGDGNIGSGNNFTGAMTLANQGLISSQVSGRTITINTASFTNSGTVETQNGGLLNIPRGYTQTAGTTRLGGGSLVAQTALVNDTLLLTAGSLEGRGTVVAQVSASGVIDPTTGTGGLVINGDLTIGTNAELRFSLAGPTPATEYDFLSEAGTVPLVLDGTLKVQFANSFQNTITGAQTFTILTSNQPLTGAFDNAASGVRLGTADGLGSFLVSYGVGSPFSPQSVVLSDFIPVPEPSAFACVVLGLGALSWRRRRTGSAYASRRGLAKRR